MLKDEDGPNRFLLMYLFCEQANAIQFLKDIGLLRRTMQCNTYNIAISVHRVTPIRPSTTASSLLILGLGHTQTPFRARGVALKSSWANTNAGKTTSSIWHITRSRRGRSRYRCVQHPRTLLTIRLGRNLFSFLTTYFPIHTPTTHHPHVISILTTPFPAPTSPFRPIPVKKTTKHTHPPARNRRLLLPHFSDFIVTEITQSRMVHSFRAILGPPFSSTSYVFLSKGNKIFLVSLSGYIYLLTCLFHRSIIHVRSEFFLHSDGCGTRGELRTGSKRL